MKEKRISFGQGKGSLTHNNREFVADNVDPLRTPQNITFVRQPIDEAYDQLFKASTERYNARQKRNDRKVHGSYYESLFGCKPCNAQRIAPDKRKSFYEDVVQIGRMEDSGIGTEDFQLVADCLKEYMEGFQNRNPNFYVFNAVLHMDEVTPHLHIDYIPVGHYKRGQDVQNGIAQASKEMGYGEGKQAIARWRASEVEVLNAICREHGIEPLPPEKSRGTLEVAEYKEQRQKADELAEQNAQTEAEVVQKEEKSRQLDEQIRKKEEKRDSILHYSPDADKLDKLFFEFDDMCSALDGYIKNPLSATMNKQKIADLVKEMKAMLTKFYKGREKSEATISELRIENAAIAKDRDEAYERARSNNAHSRELYKENTELSSLVQEMREFMSLLKQTEPHVYQQVKQLQEQIRTQREQEVQQSTTRKKKSWGLE